MDDEEVSPTRCEYRVASGPCHEALITWRQDRQAIDAQCFEFARSVGGNGFYAGHDDNVGNALAIHAVTFEGAVPAGWKERKWKSLKRTGEGIPCWPDKRTAVGKAALKAIKALPLRPSSYRVCTAIAFPASLEYHGNGVTRGSSAMGFFETLLAGWIKDTFYVSLPDVKRARQRLIDSGYTVDTPEWEPLPGMEPILKEEADLDYAREKLRLAA